MILADTSVWVDHLRSGDERLGDRLRRGVIVMHPLVIAELALGSLRQRASLLALLDDLPMLREAETLELRIAIETRQWHGRGIGLVDAALLAACLLAPRTLLWTRGRRLHRIADELGIAVRDARA